MELIGLKTCDTCRKARKALEAAGLEHTYTDVREDGLAAMRLSDLLAQFGDALVNTRSTTWRGLSEAERKQSPLELLAAHPTLMKRPVIVNGTQYHLGWGKDVQAALGL